MYFQFVMVSIKDLSLQGQMCILQMLVSCMSVGLFFVVVSFFNGEYHSCFINGQLKHEEVKGPDKGDSKSNYVEFCSSEISSF